MTTLVRNKLGAAVLMAATSIQLITSKQANRKRDLRHVTVFAFVLGLLLIPRSSFAESRAEEATPKPTDAPVTQSFGGLSFGVGLGLSVNAQNQHRVTNATLVTPTNVVRVTETNNASAALILESHYFFVPNRPFFAGTDQVPKGDWGHGPFVAIEASNGNTVITGYALGWMIGFREPTYTYDAATGWKASYSRNSWNFGLGVRVDPNAQVLGDGIVANQPLPLGETTIRYNHVAKYGVILISSFSF
jgi:hypothetical protein